MGDAAVVGGGVLGLAVAQRLLDRGENVTVFEAAPRLGGLTGAWDHEGVTWERHYHVTLKSDTRTRQLLRSIGLEDDLRWVLTKSGLFAGGDLRPFSNPIDFLRLPGLSPIDKARLGTTVLLAARQADGERTEDEAAEDWLVKWSGRRTFERFWAPLLRAKLGDGWRDASATFVAATLQRLYNARGKATRAECLGFVPGGYPRIVDRLAAVLADSGVKMNTGLPVRRVVQTPVGLEIQLDDASATFDRVIVTTTAPLAADLCPTLTAAEHRRLRSVRYVGVVCASLLLPRALSPYFMTYLIDHNAPFTAVVEMTSVIDPAELGGRTLVYLPKYTAPDDPLFDADDDAVRELFLPYLQHIHPRVKASDVTAIRVSRVRQLFALPTVGYSRSMPTTTTSIPGLQLIGSANLPFTTLSVNDTLSLLQEVR